MTKNLFPLQHNYDLLDNNGNKLTQEVTKIIRSTLKPPDDNPSKLSFYHSPLLGLTETVKLHTAGDFMPILFDNNLYWLNEFVVTNINKGHPKTPYISNCGPNIIAGELYLEDDNDEFNFVRTFCYLNKYCLKQPENGKIRQQLSSLQLVKQNVVPMNGILFLSEFDFPITALQLLQRTMGFNSKA